MKKFLIILVAALSLGLGAKADEGMWLLPYLQKLNYQDMKAKGLKLKAEDIYNSNGHSLKDAVVIFGNGCTGEIVSPEGLLFTNHHCGHPNIQSLSSVDHDYLANGFWAMNRGEELPAPGLSVRFIRSIEDVTEKILAGLEGDYTQSAYTKAVAENTKALQASMQEQNPNKTILIKNFFGGNDYFAFVIEEYKDVRLVGAPPSSIGKFGGDTDNWMWPRHTGDFSIFRVYSAPDGSPAEYSEENVPYQSPVHLKISLKGYQENDFSMVMGFPGTTNRYMSTYELDELINIQNYNRILIRGERLTILKEEMAASQKVRIQYAAKHNQSSNYWKNSIGKNQALTKLNVRGEKAELEARFTEWAAASPERERYTRALPLIEEAKSQSAVIEGQTQFLAETILSSVEIAGLSAIGNNAKAVQTEKGLAAELYKNYDENTDKRVTKKMIELIVKHMPAESQPSFIATELNAKFKGNIDAYVENVYKTSNFANEEKFAAFAANYSAEKAASDPAFVIYRSTVDKYLELRGQISASKVKFEEGHRLYIAGLKEMQPEKKFYPDANFTQRLTYGQILPYSPADGVEYKYYTTIEGIIQKEDPNNLVEFEVPAKLKELYESQDYGRYADFTGVSKKDIKNGAKGTLRVNFISNNDITGGNSGSPVLNARGELIGLAFDGNWDAMSGDINFEQRLQRCINLDVRYLLFIVDKFAGAGYLLDEMTLVE